MKPCLSTLFVLLLSGCSILQQYPAVQDGAADKKAAQLIRLVQKCNEHPYGGPKYLYIDSDHKKPVVVCQDDSGFELRDND